MRGLSKAEIWLLFFTHYESVMIENLQENLSSHFIKITPPVVF